jgi:hypothetical protein
MEVTERDSAGKPLNFKNFATQMNERLPYGTHQIIMKSYICFMYSTRETVKQSFTGSYMHWHSICTCCDRHRSQTSFLTEEMYHKLRSEGVESLELGLQNTLLVFAFGNKNRAYSSAGNSANSYRRHGSGPHFSNFTSTFNSGTPWC